MMNPWRQKLGAFWLTLAARERALLGLALALVLGALLWALAIAPAWRVLRSAPAQLEALDVQWQAMQGLAAEARELRAIPPVPLAQAQAALTAAAQRLGDKARLGLQGERAVLDVNGLAGEALAAWLAEVRASARVRVTTAQLNRQPDGVYRGKLELAIGGRP